MTNKTIHTKIIYNENAHYEQSEYEQDISIPLTIVNAECHLEPKYYYNDPIEITAFIYQQIGLEKHSIQWGKVSFYYVDQNDLSKTKQLINVNQAEVDVNGNASISFIPHNAGSIYIKYYGDPYYATEEEYVYVNNFILEQRPTYIQFKEYSPYLIDPQETITMNVKVNDFLTDTPLDYGIVTFLSYADYINREEKVIGNPCYLINGETSIKYSPIQIGSNDLFHNIELIRASYNYNNEEYNVNWKYYKQHDDFAAIAIRRENQININIPQKINNDNDYQALTVDEGGLFVATHADELVCQCEVTLNNNQFAKDADVTFIVEGISKQYTENGILEEEFYETYPAYYRHTNDRNYFECLDIKNLPEGMYQIYAQVDNPKIQINNEDYTLPVISNNIDEEITTNHGTLIEDGFFIKSDKSESFYLKIEPETTSLELTLENLNDKIITNRTINRDNILLSITGDLTEDDYAVLNNKTCYFYIPNIDATYQGTLYINKQGQLCGQLNDNVSINVGTYDMYAYIKNGIYSNNNNIIKQYNTIRSQTIQIKVKNNLENLTLRLQSNETSYPQNIKYIIESTDVDNDNINIDVYIDNVKTNITHSLSRLNRTIINTLPPIVPGEHRIKIVARDYLNVEREASFTITKGELDISLKNNQNLLASTITDLIFNVKNKTGNQLVNLDDIIFHISIANAHTTLTDWDIQQPTYIDNYTYDLIGTGCIYKSGSWVANISYEENDYYYNDDDIIINFVVNDVTPICKNIEKNVNNYVNKVFYAQNEQTETVIINEQPVLNTVTTYDSLPINVLVINKLISDTNEYFIANITDTNGNYTLEKPPSMTNTEWQQYHTIEYFIIPEHSELLNAFESAQNEFDIVNAFESVFNSHQCTNNEIITLYNNAKENNFNILFVGYSMTNDTINLYEDE